MKIKFSILLSVAILFYSMANGQSKNNWYGFRDKKTNLVGFKDSKGNIRIPAIYGEFTSSSVFADIVPVYEEKTKQNYYLLKSGKKIGLDSLYVWDYTYDRENENKIMFRDKQTDKVGFFYKDGKIVIPAVYDDALPFHNGLALVVHDGKRTCLDGSSYQDAKPCENWSWRGINALIDSHNQIIADNINVSEIQNIDWLTLKITNSIPDTTLYTSFKASTGKFYSFLNYKKEFRVWFYKNYLTDLNYQRLSASCYKELTVEAHFKDRVRKYYSKSAFLKRYQQLMIEMMKNIKANKLEVNIFKENINDYIYNGKNFSVFYTNDGEPNNQRYPVFNVVTTYYTGNKKLDHQDQFLFIRINNSYKLIGLALQVGGDK